MPKQNQGLFKKPNSRFWYADFTDASGKRTKRSTGTVDRKEAEALLAKWKLEAHQQQMWDAPPTRTYDDLMLLYLQGPSKDKRAPERDLFSAKRLTPFFQGKALNTMGPADVQAYIDYRRTQNVGPATINKELNLLSAALTYARRRLQWDVPNPVEGMRLRPPQGRIRWITREEAPRLIAEAAKVRSYLPDFIQLGLNTGMRKGEMLELSWDRVDLDQRMIYLRDVDQKNGKYGSTPLNDEAVRALERRKTHRDQSAPINLGVLDSGWNAYSQHQEGIRQRMRESGYRGFPPTRHASHLCSMARAKWR